MRLSHPDLRRRWRQLPLRVRLVGATVLLVAVALSVTGVTASNLLGRQLLTQTDSQLQQQVSRFAFFLEPCLLANQCVIDNYQFPTTETWYAQLATPSRRVLLRGDPTLVFPTSLTSSTINRYVGDFLTVPGASGGQWRVLIVADQRVGGILVVGQNLATMNGTLHRLDLLEVLIGLGVLLLLGALAYGLVRASLRPLAEVETTAAAIAAGDLSRRVPVGDSRTEVGRLSRALNAMLSQIESSFHARQESEQAARRSEQRLRRFVADASHELRTPLTGIRGFAELYRQGAADSPQDVARLMGRIEDEAVRMAGLVDDLLLLARLDQQRPLQLDPVDLLTVAIDAVHDARAVDPGRPVELTGLPGVGGVPTAPLLVLADDARLRQVVANLMANALTHTPKGTPVEVRVGREPDAGQVVLEVADRGPGLTPADAEHVFERFYRVDRSRTRSQGGTGLGLAIVAGLVEAHGGTVEVASVPGAGATFRVRLPAAPVADRAGPPNTSQPAHSGSTPAAEPRAVG
jgi:signal transduction histidine kinase